MRAMKIVILGAGQVGDARQRLVVEQVACQRTFQPQSVDQAVDGDRQLAAFLRCYRPVIGGEEG